MSLLPLFLILYSSGQTTSPYGIKSAKIEFAFSNGLQSGTKTLIFTDSGKIEKVFAAISMDTSKINNMPEGFSTNNISSQILINQTKDSVFAVDLEKQVGSKRERFNLDMSSMFNDNKESVGTDLFLNRLCDVYDLEGFKIWFWKGLVLKKEMAIDANQKIYEYATSINEDYPIKSDEFKAPKNVQFK